MLAPDTYSESEAVSGYLADQLDAIRTSAHGLDEAQARLTPCRSALSIGGLIKHATYVMQGLLAPDRDTSSSDPAGYEAFTSSFALADDETLEQALATFDATRADYLAAVADLDPDAVYDEPPAPWCGRAEATPATRRYALVHHVEELARHAGHADIVREQIDGATAASLLLAVEGLPSNDFVRAWTPG